MIIGKKNFYNDSLDIVEVYKQYSLNDEKSGDLLRNNGMYSEAIYMYIQSMEKYIKHQIARKINVTNPTFAQLIRNTGHSLEKSIDLLLEIYSKGDINLKNQIKEQIDKNVFKNININALQNNLRYPHYDNYHKNYFTIDVSNNECVIIKNMLTSLKKYIDGMSLI